MLLKVSEEQYRAYVRKLLLAISEATPHQLRLLHPSLVMVQRQATTPERTHRAYYVLQEFNKACRSVDLKDQ